MIFGLIPLTGFIAAALGAVGIILGLVGFSHARKGIATNLKTAVAGSILSVIAIALGIWGMVIVFTSVNQLAEDLKQPFSTSPPAGGTSNAVTPGADVNKPSAAPSYQLRVDGSAKAAMITWGANGSTGSQSSADLPWSKTVTGEQGDRFQYFTVSAVTKSGSTGDLTCSIVDTTTNKVVSTKRAESGGGDYGYASVICNVTG